MITCEECSGHRLLFCLRMACERIFPSEVKSGLPLRGHMRRLLESFPHRRRLYGVDTFRQLGKKQGTVENRLENLGSILVLNDNLGTAYVISIFQCKAEL